MEISLKGDFSVVVMNGNFAGHNKPFGHPALALFEIFKSGWSDSCGLKACPTGSYRL